MDGTTNAGNVEDELIVIMSFSKDDKAGKVKSFARFFSIEVPKRADADGLIACLQESLRTLGIDDVLSKACVLGSKPILIGGGTDGAAVNIASQNGMKGRIAARATMYLGYSGVGAMPIDWSSPARIPS